MLILLIKIIILGLFWNNQYIGTTYLWKLLKSLFALFIYYLV